MTLPDLSMWSLLCLGAGVAVLGVLMLGLSLHPLTAPHVRAYGARAWGVVVKWSPVLAGLLGLAGVVLALDRWLHRPAPARVPMPGTAPVPSSEPEREAIRTETRARIDETHDLRRETGVTIGDMERRAAEARERATNPNQE